MKWGLWGGTAIYFIIAMCLTVFAVNEPDKEFSYASGSNADSSLPETEEDFVENEFLTNIQELPSISVSQEPLYPNWRLKVEFVDLELDDVDITLYYSFDGVSFEAGESNWYAHFVELYVEPDTEPMLSFTEGRQNELWVYMEIEGEDGISRSQTCQVMRHTDKQELPDAEISEITVKTELSQTGWRLTITCPYSVRVGTAAIYPEYSIDGYLFSPAVDALGEQVVWNDIPQYTGSGGDKQYLVGTAEPMKSFLDRTYDTFYFRMKIEGDNYNGYSEVYFIERDMIPQPIPDKSEVLAVLPPSSNVKGAWFQSPRGLCHVTVREGAGSETLLSYLPDELPVRINLKITDADANLIAIGMEAVRYQVNWKLPQGELREGILKESAELIPPAGEHVFYGELSTYYIPQLPPVQVTVPDPDNQGEFIWVDEPFDLEVHIIPADEKISPQFGIAAWNKFNEPQLAFSLAHKPSGAKSIVPEYSVDGGVSWQVVEREDGNDIIELGYAPDRVPKQENYAAPMFFDNDKSPMKEYLEDTSRGFLIRLNIEGGVYHGVTEAFSWPGDYNYAPPLYIDTDLEGGGGNRGDVGGGTEGDGGVRPGIPGQDTEPDNESALLPEPTPDTTPDTTPDPVSESVPELQPEPAKVPATDLQPESVPEYPTIPHPMPDKSLNAKQVPRREADVQAPVDSELPIEMIEEVEENPDVPFAAPGETEPANAAEPAAEPLRKTEMPGDVPWLAVIGGGIIAAAGMGWFSGLFKRLFRFLFHQTKS